MNDEEYYDKGLTAQRKRMLTLQWLASAWAKVDKDQYKRARSAWWRHTGCGMSVDGSDDGSVKIEGHPEYVLPPP